MQRFKDFATKAEALTLTSDVVAEFHSSTSKNEFHALNGCTLRVWYRSISPITLYSPGGTLTYVTYYGGFNITTWPAVFFLLDDSDYWHGWPVSWSVVPGSLYQTTVTYADGYSATTKRIGAYTEGFVWGGEAYSGEQPGFDYYFVSEPSFVDYATDLDQILLAAFSGYEPEPPDFSESVSLNFVKKEIAGLWVYGWEFSWNPNNRKINLMDLGANIIALPNNRYFVNTTDPAPIIEALASIYRPFSAEKAYFNLLYTNALQGYYFNFPSWAPVPDWYHFATLIKATGETYGKGIAPTLDPKPVTPGGQLITPMPGGSAFNLEIWRQEPIDPDPLYDYYPRQFLNYSNLITELEDFPDISPLAELAEIGGGTVTPIYFYPWSTEPPTDQQFSAAQIKSLTTFPAIDPATGEPHPNAGQLIFDPDPDNGDIMPDSLLMKKVAAAVEADRYGVHPSDPNKPNLNNIGRLVEALAYVLGINLDPDGKNLPYPDPEYLKPEEVAKIKHLKTSQFATFDGDKGMQAATLYDIRSNVAVTDKFGKKVIQPGGAVKVWNLAQFLDQAADDTEAQLGGAALASLQVPTGDGKTYHQYQGLGHAIQDCLFMLSVESKRVDELVIQSARTIHLLQQVLMGLGLPLRPDTIDFLIGAETATAEDPPQIGVAPVASLDPSGPTITSLFGITLANLSRLVAGTIGYQVTGVSAAADTGNEEIPDPFDFEDDLPGINL